MAIEIYDKAAIVKKDNTFYYLLKHGSKNSYTCGHQSVIDDNFLTKWLSRDSRDSHWTVIAYGDNEARLNNAISETAWNAPTSSLYGAVQFGDKKNIALWYVKNKDKYIKYEDLDERKGQNVYSILAFHEKKPQCGSVWNIDLNNIQEEQKLKASNEYCGEYCNIAQHSVIYQGMPYWQLDNV